MNTLSPHTLLTLIFCVLAALAPCRAEFALRDGDRVVFLGDSITAARRYDRIIENFTLLRCPKLRVQFFNAGKGGDTAAGGLLRLERAVFARKATVAIVAFGTNDIGRGVKAAEEHRQKYLAGIRGIVEECRRRDVRVFICSEPIMNGAPDKAEIGFLQKMCDDGRTLRDHRHAVAHGSLHDIASGARIAPRRFRARARSARRAAACDGEAVSAPLRHPARRRRVTRNDSDLVSSTNPAARSPTTRCWESLSP